MSLIKDQDVLDVINAVNKDLRHDQSFRALLTKLDGEAQRRVARSYIEWLTKILEQERSSPENR